MDRPPHTLKPAVQIAQVACRCCQSLQTGDTIVVLALSSGHHDFCLFFEGWGKGNIVLMGTLAMHTKSEYRIVQVLTHILGHDRTVSEINPVLWRLPLSGRAPVDTPHSYIPNIPKPQGCV